MDEFFKLELESEVNYYDEYINMIISEYEMDNDVEVSEQQTEDIFQLVDQRNVFTKCEYNGGYSDLCDEMIKKCVEIIMDEDDLPF